MINDVISKDNEEGRLSPIILRIPSAVNGRDNVAQWLPILLAPFVGLLLLAMSIVKLWWGHVAFEGGVLLFFVWLVCTNDSSKVGAQLKTALVIGTTVQLKLVATAVLGSYPG